MSVLACDRAGCRNIMCDRLSYDYGYICNDCFEELKIQAPLNIELFMNTPKFVNTHHMDYNAIFQTKHG
jgi:hypothetical protein